MENVVESVDAVEVLSTESKSLITGKNAVILAASALVGIGVVFMVRKIRAARKEAQA